jgi:hypothetical protein|tara:strand:- start:416 stop:580 length:165 start_codon:yes stop_codon:yes gene_type:complete
MQLFDQCLQVIQDTLDTVPLLPRPKSPTVRAFIAEAPSVATASNLSLMIFQYSH